MALAAVKLAHDRMPDGFMRLEDAAPRLGVTVDHLRRECREKFASTGLAHKVNGAWYISKTADQRLADFATRAGRDRQQIAEMRNRGREERHIQAAIRKVSIIVGFDSFGGYGPVQERRICDYLNSINWAGDPASDGVRKPTTRTFRQWRDLYNKPGNSGGIAALVRKEYPSRHDERLGDAALARIETIVNAGNRITLTNAIRLAMLDAARHPNDPAWRISSYSSVRVALAARRPQILRTLCDKGERAATASCVPKLRRNYEQIAAGDECNLDTRTLDVWCRVLTARGWKPIRKLMLTAAEDIRSRVLVGWVLAPYGNTTTITAVLKRAFATYGKPLIIRTDWGEDYRAAARMGEYKDFDGRRIGNILDQLGVSVKKVEPYSPWAKPIESFFRPFKEQFDKLQAGFWGGCPSERHEDRFKFVRDNLEKLPTIEDLTLCIAAWLEYYHHTPHGAHDLYHKTPLEAMAAFRDGPVRRESDEVLDALFRTWVGPKLVRRDGIVHGGRWYGSADPRLVALQGTKVLLGIQPDDAGRALVCNLARKPLFTVECAPISGMTQQQVKEMHRQRKKLLRPYREQARDARDWMLSQDPLATLSAQAAHAKAARPAPAPAPSLTVVRPELESALDAAGPAPSEAASKRLRTGTDDDPLDLADIADCAPRAVEDDAVVEDEISWADMTGVW